MKKFKSRRSLIQNSNETLFDFVCALFFMKKRMINDVRLSLSSSFLEFNSVVQPCLKNGKILSGYEREGEKAVDFEAIGYKENTTTVMSIGRCQ